MMNNLIQQVGIEGTPLQAVDGKGFAQLSTAVLLDFQFGQAGGVEAGVEVKL